MASTSQQSGSHMKEKGNPLAVTGKAKLDRFNERKESLNKRPSTLLVISKWMVTGVFGLLLLFCLSFNKLSIVATGRWHLKKDGDHDPQRIVMLFTIIIIPYAITFLRSVWVTIGRKDLPRPKTSAIIYCIVASLLEVIGITLVACEVIVGEKAYIPVLLMNAVLLLPLSSLTAQHWRNKSWRLILSTIFSLLGTTATIVLLFLDNPDIKNTVILLVGIFLVSISWMPWLQEKMMEIKIEQPIQEIPEEIPKGSFRLEQFAQNYRVTDLRAMQISENNSHWRSLRISSFIKLISTLPAILIYKGISDGNFSNVFSDFKDGWSSSDWSPNVMLLWFFVSNVLTAVLGYMVAVFACRTCMDRGAFVLPLFLSTPLTVALLTVYDPCSVLLDHVDKSTNCGNPPDVKMIALIVASVLCFAVSQALSVGFNAFKGSSIILEKETKLFRFASFNGVFLEQWLLVDKRQDFEGLDRNAQQSQHKKSKVFICTTMYNENQTEMKQLLESVYAVNAAQISGDQTSCHFESHIFLDGSIRDDDLQENALRLLSLLPESLGIVDLRKGTKIITPYGMAISWKLPTPNGLNGMNFTIHFKDIRKVKNKKRWSQIMYISYVLDFLNKNFKQGTDSSSEDDSFILTTDADVRFEASDVETLLDLMTRDHTVGAVCARTYPLGSGPLVWYQKFEYAIGHWFQKAAEHVLGSVLCAPGCFSVYRCSALRDIVPIYATGVKKAFDFLIKDMGEDRWLCTLMVQSGWRIEYCAASQNKTYCPEDFDEFFKQRRRWIASTMANIWKLIAEWSFIHGMNHKVSILFCMYQIFLFASTIVGPSTIIMVVSGGLVYAWGANLVVTMVLQIIVCLLFSLACIKLKSSQQLMIAKILTFLYSMIMAAVAVGVAIQVANDFENPDTGETDDYPDYPDEPTVSTKKPDAISIHIPYSVTTVYLTALASLFFVTGLLHFKEVINLLYGLIYLLCLPSCYLILLIYTICNITDRSWGTREKKAVGSSLGMDSGAMWKKVQDIFRTIFFCCFKSQSPDKLEDSKVIKKSKEETEVDILESQEVITETAEVWIPSGSQTLSGKKGTKTIVTRRKPINDGSKSVEEWLKDKKLIEQYAEQFKEHGYENTLFLSGMDEKTLTKKIGVNKLAHKINLMGMIDRIPNFDIDVGVPNNVGTWLDTIGLWMYKTNFEAASIKTPESLEALKDMSKEQLKEELGITKHGHRKRLLIAIDKLRYPTEDEETYLMVRKKVSEIDWKLLKDINKDEHKFWEDLINVCLVPNRDAFGRISELKEGLESLRLHALLGGWAVNCLWMVLALTLSGSAQLTAAGTNPLGLAFLLIFGLIFIIQFLCMIVHRLETLAHFIARLPYKLSGNFRQSWTFGEGEESQLDEKDALMFKESLISCNLRLSQTYRQEILHIDEETMEKQPLLPKRKQ